MNKKTMASIAITCISVVTLLISSTFAWFTDTSDVKVNKVETGDFIIEVVSKTLVNGEMVDFPEEEFINIMPTQVISKIVYVKNNGDSPAWVRITVEQAFLDADGNELPDMIGEEYGLLFDAGSDWTYNDEDGCYYYSKALNSGDMTSKFIEKVVVNPALTNEYAGGSAKFIVTAEAVQSNYNGETPEEAEGWE